MTWHAPLDGLDAAWLVRFPDGRVEERDADRTFSSASMVKTFLLLVAWSSPRDAPLTVAPAHRTGGDGVLTHLTLPVTLPLRDVLALMVVVSDNTATAAVIDHLGGPAACTARFRELGFASTAVRPRDGQLGVTTPREHDAAIRRLVADPEARALLEAQQDHRALRRGIAARVPFAHKTGTVDDVRHDGGVARHPETGAELAITVFTAGGPHDEWVDHPALVAMGAAARALVQEVWTGDTWR